MALLREQRNLIGALDSFHKENLPPEKKRIEIGAYFGSIDETQIPRFLFKKSILLTDQKNFIVPANDTPEFRDRRSKIGVLYKSCLDEKFIVREHIDISNKDGDVFDPPQFMDVGVRVSNRGSDLLNPLGFATIFFEKHSKLIVFAWGSFAGFALTAFIWTVGNVPSVIYWIINRFLS